MLDVPHSKKTKTKKISLIVFAVKQIDKQKNNFETTCLQSSILPQFYRIIWYSQQYCRTCLQKGNKSMQKLSETWI